MSSIAYECETCGAKEFDPGPCWCCGGGMLPYRAGAPASQSGAPTVIGDRIRPYFDYGLGCKIDSRSQLNRKLSETGMQLTPTREFRNKYPSNVPQKPGTSYFYGGRMHRRDRVPQFE